MTFVEPPQPPSGQYPRGQYPQGQYPQQKAPMPAGRVVDVTISVAILVCGAVVLLALVGIALFFGLMSSGSCSTFGGGCGSGAGWAVAVVGPAAVFATTIAVTIVRLRRRRTAWWIALVGSIVSVAIWFLGSALASVGAA